MNASAVEVFEGLRAATLALSFAIALVLSLRAPMRRWFGASAAYALWWLLPAALLALLLPPPTVEVAMVAVPVSAAPAAVAAPSMPVRDDSARCGRRARESPPRDRLPPRRPRRSASRRWLGRLP